MRVNREARLLVDAATSDGHRTAGTWARLVDAALAASSEDEEAAALTHDLLRGFPQKIEGRVRGALLLLDFAREVESGVADEGWVERARTVCAGRTGRAGRSGQGVRCAGRAAARA